MKVIELGSFRHWRQPVYILCITASDDLVDLSLINKFVAYLKEVYCIPVSWNAPNQVHLDDLSRRFKQVLNSQS